MRSHIPAPIGNIFGLFTILVITILLPLGCSKDKAGEVEKELLPAGIETSALLFLTPVSVELTGNIINKDGQKIIDHGFIYWYGAEGELAQGMKVSLGNDITSGFFTAKLKDLKFPVVNNVQAAFVMKAYVTDKNGTRYGQIFSSNFKGGITREVSPLGGKSGDMITITGNYKDLKASDIKVTFSDVEARIKTLTDKAITVEIPGGIPAVHGQKVGLKVQVGVVSFNAATSFYIWANIKDIHPKSGPIGTKVTFTGDNLPTTKDGMYVTFGDAYTKTYYEDAYFVRVPADINTEKIKLYYYQGDNDRKELPFEFTVTPPIIKSIDPNPVFNSQEFTIHMDNMMPFFGGNEPILTIANSTNYVRQNENGDLVFRPNLNLRIGESYPITVTYGPHVVKAPQPLKIASQAASGFFPEKGFPGTVLHVTGKFAKGSFNNYVAFGTDGQSSANVISETELLIKVPLGLKNKTYGLTLFDTYGNKTGIPGIFESQPVKFDAASPASGPAGTLITVTGQGLYDDSGKGFVGNFGGVVVYSTSVSLNKFLLKVPDPVMPGTYPLKLENNGVIYDTGFTFTVTK